MGNVISWMNRLMSGSHRSQSMPVNIGNPAQFNIRQLAALVHHRLDPNLELIKKSLQ
jgi:hypothetical protein